MRNIKKLQYSEKPYEKMLMYGEKALTDAELLSIIIKTGTKKYSALEVASSIIKENTSEFDNLRFLQNLSIPELMKTSGIGKVKAIELKAVGEIAKRISKPLANRKIKVKNKEDIARLFLEELQNEKNEILKEVVLNNGNEIKKILNLAIGNEENLVINIKTILSEPIKLGLPKIILVHNHPAGNPAPSNRDIEFTKKVLEAAKLLDIKLLDHIIIGDGTYESVFSANVYN